MGIMGDESSMNTLGMTQNQYDQIILDMDFEAQETNGKKI